MKKLVIAILLLTSFILTGCETEQEPIIPTDPKVSSLSKEDLASDYVSWYGRHQLIDDNEHFYYTATGFKISFTGRIVDITLSLSDKNNDIYFSLAKDDEALLDGEVLILSDEQQTFRITFDTYDDHLIQLVKRSEPEDGVTALVSLETNGKFNKLIEDDTLPHFLLIGASGISGHGALGSSGQGRTTENSSSLHSFGYLTAVQFGGTYEFVSNSGWGLAFGYNDTTGVNNIAKAYDYIGIDAHQDIIDVAYDHNVVPDIIIVNIGGNDYTAVINKLSGFAKEDKITEFKNMVAEFILKLREDAPNAHIFWTMTSGSLNGTAAASVFSLLDPADQAYVHMVVIKGVGDDGDPVGANNHCSYITHQKSADILAAAIEEFTGFRTTE